MASAESKEEPKKQKQPGAFDIEEKDEKKQEKTALDVAFVLDCTGSMNSYIQSCKDNIISISTRLSKEVENCDVQFALVSYRDIPPQDKTFVTKKLDFTPVSFKIQIELEGISASGGGDAPEALTSALWDCRNGLKWRNNSIKIIIVITDAPPHGLETKVNDGFPNGDPDTFNTVDEKEGDDKDSGAKKFLNVIEIIQAIRNELKAVIYSVACEPDLSCNHDFATDFMQYIAEYTKGRFLPLSSAKLLPDVIVGSVKQQLNLKKAKDSLEDTILEIKKEHGDDISADKLNQLIAEKWKAAGVKKKEISIGTLYRKERPKDNINLLMNEQKIKSLKDFKKHAKIFGRLNRTDFRHLNKNKKKITKKIIYTKKTKKTYDSESDYSDEDEDEDDDDDSDDDSESESESNHKKKKRKMHKMVVSKKREEESEEDEEEDEDEEEEEDDDDDDSDSCAEQQVYSESDEWCAADIDDMY